MEAGEVDAQLRRGILEYCVLALLEQRPKYGFELIEELEQRGDLLGNQGTLYPLLSRIQKEGRLASHWQESNSGPPRKYYSLTGEGGAALEQFRTTWQRFKKAVDAIVVGGRER